MIVHQQSFQTAKELIDYFQNNKMFLTTGVINAFSSGRGNYIYRGQSDAKWSLCPTAFRSITKLKNYSPQTAGLFNGKDHASWLGWHLKAEERAVFIFLDEADKLGIGTSVNYTNLNEHTELINKLFKNSNSEITKTFPVIRALEDFALAQHHGVPTRLLDWTESPFIACFFAAYGASSVVEESNRVKSEQISINCFHTSILSKSKNIIKVNVPRHNNTFIRMQKGLFTHFPKANEFFYKNNSWPSVEDIVAEDNTINSGLHKYTIPTGEADNLLRILFDYDITKYHLMPSLDNIADSVSYRLKLFSWK